MVVWGTPTQEDVAITLKLALEDVLETQWHEVQGTKRSECGNYRDHSLFGAKEYAKQVLEMSISLDPFDNSTVV
jgi:S-ribosylhomocysteine lyase